MIAQSILFAQKASGYKTVHVETAGTLENYISTDEKKKLIGLKLTGKLNTFDYDFMRTMPALESVDLAQIDNTTIPASCFKSSTIKTVILPLNLEAIPDNAFKESSITSIEIPGTVLSIGASAFEGCSSLAGNLVLPEGLQTIGERAFYQCEALTGSLHIPNSVTSLGTYAFYECSGFTGTLTFGTGITTIPEYCFKGCSGFTGNLVIPDQVATIGTFAFNSCEGFKGYLTIGSGIKQIGTDAFCRVETSIRRPLYFTKVYCKATTRPSASVYSFGTPNSSYKYSYLGVPIGCKTAYDKEPWSSSFTIIEEIEF